MGKKATPTKKEGTFNFIAMDVPATKRHSKYDDAVQSFLSLDTVSAKVELGGTSNTSLLAGLTKACKKITGAKVVTKNKDIYLVKIAE